ncbi:MAG: class I SAM-dependent methyltransferase [Chloroflexota bacterium]
MNLPYLIPRLIRHFLPERIVRILLLRGIIIQAGLETSDPTHAVQRYADILSEHGLAFENKRVLVFGYGGRFDIGVELLRQGAKHVILCDKYAPPDEVHNRKMLVVEEQYFVLEHGDLRPRPEWMTLFEGDIRDVHVRNTIDPVDIVLSSSVYEHVDDVEGITRALARLTKPDGMNIHYVDLRDHFFKYPFEMLQFSEKTWRNFLNPSSNHNRYRLWNYRQAFEAGFDNVGIEILARDSEAFRRKQPVILPQFLSENAAENDVTLIRVIARDPMK